MKIEIQSIQAKGKQNLEFVQLEVLEACDLRYYMLTDTTYSSDSKTISNKLRHTYWFNGKQVAKGDYVRLWTGKGTDSTVANQSGTTTHNIYWGLQVPVWNNDGDGAVLFEITTWKAKKA